MPEKRTVLSLKRTVFSLDPFAVVKECKGAALSILVLLASNQQLGGGPVTQEWLERHSGYTDKPVSQALAYLNETGRIQETIAGWVLAGDSTRAGFEASSVHSPAPTGVGDSDRAGFEACSVRSPAPTCPDDYAGPGFEALSGRTPDSMVLGEGEGGHEPPVKQKTPARQKLPAGHKPHGRKRKPVGQQPPSGQSSTGAPGRRDQASTGIAVFDRRTHASSLRLHGEQAPGSNAIPALAEIAGEEISLARERGPSRKISDSPTTTSAIDLNINLVKAVVEEGGVGKIPSQIDLKHVEANLAAFKRWGVGRNEKTILLSARSEVTPELIEDIARRLVSERRFSTGLLITAVQCGDRPLPDLPKKYGMGLQDRDPSRYAEWEE